MHLKRSSVFSPLLPFPTGQTRAAPRKALQRVISQLSTYL